ncbi:MAG: hypothetical protein ACRDHZ_09580 [Ktedonobacteraceae bacterium]
MKFSNRQNAMLALGTGIIFFLIATLMSDVIARISVGNERMVRAISEHLHYAVTQPIGTLLLLCPFLILSWMSASLSKRKGRGIGLGFLVASGLALTSIYFFGYQASQAYLQQRMWTAAALSVGLLPVESVPVILICLGARWLIGRSRGETAT